MAQLADGAALEVWETGRTRRPLERCLLVLRAANDEVTIEELAGLDVQARDRALIETRRDTFGDLLELYAACPGCGTELEFTVSASTLLDLEPAAERQVELDGWTVEFRLPTSGDIAEAASRGADVFAACVLGAEHDGRAAAAVDVPSSVRAAVEAAMAAGAPAADIEFAAPCVACGAGNRFGFDPGEYLWTEIAARARRLLGEVVILARAFGWTEREILTLPARRRQTYLELVG